MKAKLLIVDADPDIATMLEDHLQASDYGTVIAPHVAQSGYPTPDGLEVLKRLPKVRPAEDLPVIVMTTHASIDAAVEAIKPAPTIF